MKNSMRIAYISNEYPPETGYGGIGTYTRYMAEGMAARGHAVWVLCRSASGMPYRREINGVHVQRLSPGTYPLPRSRYLYHARALARRFAHHYLVKMAWAREVRSSLRDIESREGAFDVVEYPECGGEGLLLCTTSSAATVARLHTPWSHIRSYDLLHESSADRLLLGWMERRSTRRATGITSPSSALARRMERQWCLKDVTVFPNPIHSSEYRRTNGRDWIYVGRVERRKGVHVLIAAYARLCRRGTPPLLLLLGRPYGTFADGTSYGSHIQALIERHGLADRVTWVKGVDHDAVGGYLRRAGVAIFPSLWENFPYACLEAMASELAVVASRCGGYPEMIDNHTTGRLFTPESSEELAAILAGLADNPRAVRKLGKAAAESVRRRFDTAVVCEKAELYYAGIR